VSINTHNAEFIKSAANSSGFIRDAVPKVVFAGRSNAGKSSTVNALLNRKSLARVSESPGKTIHINYYLIDKKLYLVDLPGYGFAKAAKTRKDDWGRLMDEFFGDTSNITVCVLIVDARHKPSAEDHMMCGYLKETGIPFLVCANKIDSVKKSELHQNLREIVLALDIADDQLFPYSAKSREGIEALRNRLFGLAETDSGDQAGKASDPSENIPE